jgi:hypothetical protein
MDDRWAALAARLNEAAEPPSTAPVVDLGEAAAARDALLADLLAFGQALRGVVAEADGAVVRWSTALRAVRFEPDGGEVAVRWSEPAPRSGRLYREEALGGRWVLAVKAALSEDRVPLIDAGLLRLVTVGLDQPAPAEDGASAASPSGAALHPPADTPPGPPSDTAPERRRTL